MIWLSRKIFKNNSVVIDRENPQAIENYVEFEVMKFGGDGTARPLPDDETGEYSPTDAASIVAHASKQAGRMLERARKETQKLQDDAQAALEQERKQTLANAEAEGFERGYSEGYDEGVSAARALRDEAERIKEQTILEREEAIALLEPELIRLVGSILQKVGLNTARINPTVTLNLIRQGLTQSSFTGDVTLRVSKDDYDYVITHKEYLLEYVEGGANLEIVKDHSLGVGDCLIETPFGVVDSSLNMQLEEIKQDLALILRGNADL
jgi:flagellar assembly protein FliH